MCHRRPHGRARFRALNNMPSAVLVLRRTPGRKFVEKPIRERRACKSATFSRRRLHSATRRRQAYRRKAGRLMEFRRERRFRGDLRDIQHTVEETSTRVLDRKIGLAQCRPRLPPILAPRARSLQSCVAMRLAPSAPGRRWRNLLNYRQKSRKLREEQRKIQFISQRAIRGNPRRTRESFLDFAVDTLLKCRDAGVVSQSFS